MKYAIIGAGMSGLSIANILKDHGNDVVVFEKESRPGGMIKCDRVNGNTFFVSFCNFKSYYTHER